MLRLDAEGGEEVAGNQLGEHRRLTVVVPELQQPHALDGDHPEGRQEFAEVLVFKPGGGDVLAGVVLRLEQLDRSSDAGQRVQQGGLQPAEDHGVGPDADRQREDNDERKPGRFRQRAEGETEVGEHGGIFDL